MRGLSKLYLCACEREGCLANSELVHYFMELDKSSLTEDNSEKSPFSFSLKENYPSSRITSRATDGTESFLSGIQRKGVEDEDEKGEAGSPGRRPLQDGSTSFSLANNFRAAAQACPTVLDFSKNYIGDAGLAAVFRVLPLLRWVTHVNAQGCGAGKQAVKALCDVLTMELPITTSGSSSSPATCGASDSRGHATPLSLPLKEEDAKGQVMFPSSFSSLSSPPEMCFGTPLLPLERIDLRGNAFFACSGRMLCKALQARRRLVALYREKISFSSTEVTDTNDSTTVIDGVQRCGKSSMLPREILPVEVLVDYDGFPPSTASKLWALNHAAHEEKQRRRLERRMRREEEQMKIFCVSSLDGGTVGNDMQRGAPEWKTQPTGEHLIYRIPEFTVSPSEEEEGDGSGVITSDASLLRKALATVGSPSERGSGAQSLRRPLTSVPFYDHSNVYLSRVVSEMNHYMEEYLVAFRCLSRCHRSPALTEKSGNVTMSSFHSTPCRTQESCATNGADHYDSCLRLSHKNSSSEQITEKEDPTGAESNAVEDVMEAGDYVGHALAAAELCVDIGADTLTFLPFTTASIWYTHDLYDFWPSDPLPHLSCRTEERGDEKETDSQGTRIPQKEDEKEAAEVTCVGKEYEREELLWFAELHHHVGALLRGFYANPHLEKEVERHRGPVLGIYMAQLKELFYTTTGALASDPRWRSKFQYSFDGTEKGEEGVAVEMARPGFPPPASLLAPSESMALSSSSQEREQRMGNTGLGQGTATRSSVIPPSTAGTATSPLSLVQQMCQLESLYYRIVAALVTRRMSDLPSMAVVEARLQEIRRYMIDFMCEGKTNDVEPMKQVRWIEEASTQSSSLPPASSSSLRSSRLFPSPFSSLKWAAEARSAWPVWCAETKYFLFNEAKHRRQWNAMLIPRERQQVWWIPRPLAGPTHSNSPPSSRHLAPPIHPHSLTTLDLLHTNSTLPQYSTGIPPRYRSLLQCSCSRRLASSFPSISHTYTEETSVRARRQVCSSLPLPRPCPFCCHAALSILPSFFHDPVVLRRMAIQQRVRDALPMEVKVFMLDMTIRRRSRAGYIPRIFGVGTRLFSKQIQLKYSIPEEEGAEDDDDDEEADIFISTQYSRGGRVEKRRDGQKTAVSSMAKRPNALETLLAEWASLEHAQSKEKMEGGRAGNGTREGAGASISHASHEETPLPRLCRRQLVSVMDYFAVIDGNPKRMLEFLSGFEEWYRLMMVESFDAGHPSPLSPPPSST